MSTNVMRVVTTATSVQLVTIQLVGLIALATKAMKEMVSFAQVGTGFSCLMILSVTDLCCRIFQNGCTNSKDFCKFIEHFGLKKALKLIEFSARPLMEQGAN